VTMKQVNKIKIETLIKNKITYQPMAEHIHKFVAGIIDPTTSGSHQLVIGKLLDMLQNQYMDKMEMEDRYQQLSSSQIPPN